MLIEFETGPYFVPHVAGCFFFLSRRPLVQTRTIDMINYAKMPVRHPEPFQYKRVLEYLSRYGIR